MSKLIVHSRKTWLNENVRDQEWTFDAIEIQDEGTEKFKCSLVSIVVVLFNSTGGGYVRDDDRFQSDCLLSG